MDKNPDANQRIYIRTKSNEEQFSDFYSYPLQQQYSDSQSMSVLNYMLGIVQAGACGYLAYEHLKKYDS